MAPDPALNFDTISVEPLTQLSAIASLARISEGDLRAFNPSLVASRTPPTGCTLRVPAGQGEVILAGLKPSTKPRTVRVRLGDNLGTVAARFGVTEPSLLSENGVEPDRVGPGTVLVLPKEARKIPVDPIPPMVVVHHHLVPSASERLVFYEVQPGDDLSRIAARFQVSEADLGRNNSLDPEALLRPGMVLQLLVSRALDLKDVRYFEGPDVHTLLAGSPEFHQYYEGLRGYERIVVVARTGDTLSSIGRRFGLTAGSMERINRRSQSTPLAEGEAIIVYTDKGRAPAKSTGGPLPLPPIVVDDVGGSAAPVSQDSP